MSIFCPIGIGGTNIDTTKLKLFVGGLPQSFTSQNLYDLFRPYGQIREACIIPDQFRRHSRGYGFVTFKKQESASKVLKSGAIYTNKGKKITTALASANVKPRRAHFDVKHGVSGHKPLPLVAENSNISPVPSRNKISEQIVKVCKIRKSRICERGQSRSRSNSRRVKVGVYNDPSLLRTANIQEIPPAILVVPESKLKKNNSTYMDHYCSFRLVDTDSIGQKYEEQPTMKKETQSDQLIDSIKQKPNNSIFNEIAQPTRVKTRVSNLKNESNLNNLAHNSQSVNCIKRTHFINAHGENTSRSARCKYEHQAKHMHGYNRCFQYPVPVHVPVAVPVAVPVRASNPYQFQYNPVVNNVAIPIENCYIPVQCSSGNNLRMNTPQSYYIAVNHNNNNWAYQQSTMFRSLTPTGTFVAQQHVY